MDAVGGVLAGLVNVLGVSLHGELPNDLQVEFLLTRLVLVGVQEIHAGCLDAFPITSHYQPSSFAFLVSLACLFPKSSPKGLV